MTKKLSGKVAIITGASSGIGWASAIELAKEGASLVLTARRQERLEKLVSSVRDLSGDARIVVGDTREEHCAEQAVQTALGEFGALDILVNNVGVGNSECVNDLRHGK
jgi:3-oxoacyl-[acyl-carrier protein] reductase